ncbi:MAG UNVERIFIED_CONTAM: hypothetical protein LVR29_31515 [Microcystis novacekii LVE1205-3]
MLIFSEVRSQSLMMKNFHPTDERGFFPYTPTPYTQGESISKAIDNWPIL